MTLQQYNSTILEWLILSGHEERALKFWEELGCPSGVDYTELRQRTSIKQAIKMKDFGAASDLIISTRSPEMAEQCAHALFRLAFARLVTMINQSIDPMDAIKHARESVVPLIRQLPDAMSGAYTTLLNSFMALLVLPKSASPPGTSELRDEAHLQNWVMESVQACFQDKATKDARLTKIIDCYRVINEETA